MKKVTYDLFPVILLSILLASCGGGGGGDTTPTGDTGLVDGGGGGITPTTDWVTRSSGLSPKITAAAWSGSKYIAITETGSVVSSTDGITWNTASLSSGAGGLDVVWGNGMFVSSGSGCGIKTSPDGVTWTSRNTVTCSDKLYGVAWSGTQFVIAGAAGRIYTSNDGINWTLQASNAASNDTFWDVASSSTVHVAAGGTYLSEPLVRYSTDGVTWNTPTFDAAPTSMFIQVMWDGSKFVLSSGNSTYTSTDGASWTRIGIGTYADSIIWDGSQYLQTTLSGASASTDLTTWNSIFDYINHSSTQVVHAPELGQYLLVGYNNWTIDAGWIATSPDASNWTVRVGSDPKKEVLWNGSQFIALDTDGRLFSSTDGMDWTSSSGLTMDYASEVYDGFAYSPSLARYVAASSKKIMTSDDGVNWTGRHADTFLTTQSVIWTGSKFILAGWNGRYLDSVDGITWNSKNVSGTITPTPHLYDVAWSDTLGLYVVVTINPTSSIYTSADEVTWNELGAAAPAGLYGIVWTGSRFVAVGSNGTIVTSADGVNWSDRSIASGPTFYDVKVVSGKVVAVGSSGKVYVSIDDGINWMAQTTDTTNILYAVAASPTRAVAVGDVGTVISQ